MSACRAFFMNWVSVLSSITRKATRNRARVIAAPVWKCSVLSRRFLATRNSGRMIRKK
jgi:hypothetical protein